MPESNFLQVQIDTYIEQKENITHIEHLERKVKRLRSLIAARMEMIDGNMKTLQIIADLINGSKDQVKAWNEQLQQYLSEFDGLGGSEHNEPTH